MVNVDTLVSTLAGTAVGTVLGFTLHWIYDRSQRAELGFGDELFIESFRRSVRVSLVVRHIGGSRPCVNAVGYLTIDVEGLDSLEKLAVEKDRKGECELKKRGCGENCANTTYLANPRSGVRSEPLPWSISIECGRGMEGIEYRHLTHIPVGGEGKLRIFDLYKVEDADKGERFYLVKVHSEYGTEKYPRICLKLPIANDPRQDLCIHFNIKIVCQELKKPASTTIELCREDNKYILKYRRWSKPLDEILRDVEYMKLEEPVMIF